MAIKIAHITSDVIGVPYVYCVLMKKLGLNMVLYTRNLDDSHVNFSDNSQNVDMRYLEENPILRYIQILKLNNEYDILHLHDGGGFLEAIFCGFSKAKIIYHFHGSQIREGMPNFTKFTQIRKMYWKNIGIHSKVLVSTPDLLPHWKGAELLLDPIDQAIFQVPKIQDVNHPYILSPHWCDDSIKGTNIVFSAWQILKEKFPNMSLHVINWGKDADFYKNLTKNDSSVIWHELLPRKKFFELLSGATIFWGQFILPIYSLSEIEAFVMKIPVVSESNISYVELVKRTEKLILDDKICSDMLEKQNQILLKYDSDILSKQLYNIYMDVLDKK